MSWKHDLVSNSCPFWVLKVTFSEKATKIDKIVTVNLTVCSNRQIDGEDFIIFVVFLENKNFTDQDMLLKTFHT
mgnify:CR=1 FL=1